MKFDSGRIQQNYEQSLLLVGSFGGFSSELGIFCRFELSDTLQLEALAGGGIGGSGSRLCAVGGTSNSNST
jgi:hypothetical protein